MDWDSLMDWNSLMDCQGAQSRKERQKDQRTLKQLGGNVCAVAAAVSNAIVFGVLWGLKRDGVDIFLRTFGSRG